MAYYKKVKIKNSNLLLYLCIMDYRKNSHKIHMIDERPFLLQ